MAVPRRVSLRVELPPFVERRDEFLLALSGHGDQQVLADGLAAFRDWAAPFASESDRVKLADENEWDLSAWVALMDVLVNHINSIAVLPREQREERLLLLSAQFNISQALLAIARSWCDAIGADR